MDIKSKKGNKDLNKNAFLLSEAKIKREAKKALNLKVVDTAGEPIEIKDGLPKKGVFKQYEKLEVIAGYITEDFLKNTFAPIEKPEDMNYKTIIEKGLTYFMSKSDREESRSGLLSICPAVLTAMKLWSALSEESNKELSEEKGKSGDKKGNVKTKKSRDRDSLKENIKTGINAILKIIYRDNEPRRDNDDVPVFDASPFEYEDNTFTKGLLGRSYIDSISWAVPLFLRIVNLTDKGGKPFFDTNNKDERELIDIAKFLAKWCLRYINKSVIWSDNKDAPNAPIGWNYTNLADPKGAERSLNFTYAASTVYLSFYAEYSDIIDAMRRLERPDVTGEFGLELNPKYWEDDLKRELEKVEEFSKKYVKVDSENTGDGDENISGSDNELVNEKIEEIKEAIKVLIEKDNVERIKTFMYFNEGKRVTNEKVNENTQLSEIGHVFRLKWNLEHVSRDIWKKIEDNIEKNFFYDDQSFTLASTDAITSGGQTNALFSGLLSIGILLNSGYELIIGKDRGDEDESVKMQEAMILHIQKTQRFFDELYKAGNAFGVDTLILRFSQKINDGCNVNKKDADVAYLSDKALADKLRKHYIRVNSLTPLLLKTNNILSKYVIKYPQKQMGESLEQISKQRVRDNGGMWLWESDKYNAVATYYYVDAIFSFYEYYSDYEKLYIDRYEELRNCLIRDAKYENDVRDYCEKALEKYNLMVSNYEDKIEKMKEDHKEEIEKKEAEISKSKVGDELVKVLGELVKNIDYFNTSEFCQKILENMRKHLADELMNKYKRLPTENKEIVAMLGKASELSVENKAKNGVISSLLQALLVDIILPMAVESKWKDDDDNIKLGKQSKWKQQSEFVLEGRKILLDEKKINSAIAGIFDVTGWQNQ